MNGQITIDGFNNKASLQEVSKTLEKLEGAVSVHEELLEIAKLAGGEERNLLNSQLVFLRESIWDAFSFLVDEVGGEKLASEISESVKAQLEAGLDSGISAVKAFYLTLKKYIESVPEEKGGEVLIAGLPEDIKSEIETALKTASDSGQAFLNDSPVVKRIMRPEAASKEREEVRLSNKADAVFTVLEGWLDPYEVAILEEIGKFKFLEKQTTTNGKTFCTLGQLYRALRGGGDQSPTAKQREGIMRDLQTLSENDRKITFRLNEYAKLWGGFETNGGRMRIVSFDEFFGKIRGQEDTLIVFDDTIILHAISENLKMYEIIPQEIKAIQEKVYTLKLADGGTLKGNARKIRHLMNKQGITEADIVAEEVGFKKMSLSRPRIAIRTQLLKFIFGYLRARTANAPHSNKLPYTTIFQNCNINEKSRETVKRSTEDIKAMLEYFQMKEVISSWREYANRGSKRPDGIEIFISKELIAAEGGGI